VPSALIDGPVPYRPPPLDDVLGASKVEVGRDRVIRALVVAVVIAVADEACDGLLEIGG